MPLAVIAFLLAVLLSCGAQAEKRVALVIGNSAYKHAGELANPKNDATDIGAALKALGFDVTEGIDLDKAAIERRLREFTRKLEGADVALFFYAGHGLQIRGTNYILGIDAKLDAERDVEFEAIKLDSVLIHMEREAKTNIVFLDACRNNPLARNLSRALGARGVSENGGLAPVALAVGTFIAFATQPGNVALDGTGRNSPFTAALKERISTPDMSLTDLMVEVRNAVLGATNGNQVPWDNSSLRGRFYFNPQARPAANQSMPAMTQAGEAERAWLMTKDTDNIVVLEAFAARFKDTFYADLARARINELQRRQVAVATPTPAPSSQPVPIPATPGAPAASLQSNGAWIRLCQTTDTGAETCGVVHERYDGATGMRTVGAEVREAARGQSQKLLVKVPLGMLLQPGMRATVVPKDKWEALQRHEQIDDKGLVPVSIAYTRCDPTGCLGETDTNAGLQLEEMKTAGGMRLFSINAGGAPVAFDIPLDGLGSALTGPPTNPTKYMEERSRRIESATGRTPSNAVRSLPFDESAYAAVEVPLSTKDMAPTAQQDAWVKLCEKATVAIKDKNSNDEKKDRNICLTHHERLDGNTGAVHISAAVREIEGQDQRHLMIMVPLGVLQQPGLRAVFYPKPTWDKLRKDGRIDVAEEAKLQVIHLTYTLCHPAGCTAEIEVTPPLRSILSGGGGFLAYASFNTVRAPSVFPVTLAGFDKAFRGAPVDSKAYAEARQKLMQEIAKRQRERR